MKSHSVKSNKNQSASSKEELCVIIRTTHLHTEFNIFRTKNCCPYYITLVWCVTKGTTFSYIFLYFRFMPPSAEPALPDDLTLRAMNWCYASWFLALCAPWIELPKTLMHRSANHVRRTIHELQLNSCRTRQFIASFARTQHILNKNPIPLGRISYHYVSYSTDKLAVLNDRWARQ